MSDKLLCHILFSFREGPWGGCNQFLTALREELRVTGNWTDSPSTADVILIDSFNDAMKAIGWKRRLPSTPFVHRIDGPISIYRGRDRYVDRLIYAIGSRIADGVVFQSQYSMKANRSLGMPQHERWCVINNAPNNKHFWPLQTTSGDGRIRLIAASWSLHNNKGFDVYSYLDQHLDFSRYSMTFVGNSPVAFTNIRHVPPQDIPSLAELLRNSDIYVFASRHDSCSNSLLEALACGLPAVALRSGGNPELLGAGGVLFSGTFDVLACIDTVASSIKVFQAAIIRRNIAQVAGAYLKFFAQVCTQASPPRRLTTWGSIMLRGHLAFSRVRTGWDRIVQLLGWTHICNNIAKAKPHAPE
jgi:glycosyltransferase involved in cell wall biosynthesis